MNRLRPWRSKKSLRISRLLLAALLAVATLASCNDPIPGFTTKSPANSASARTAQLAKPSAPEDCPASAEWIPEDGGAPPPLALFNPLPHPNTECPFYRGGWQNFLIATQGDSQGDPVIASYPTIDDLFVKTRPLAAGALAQPGTHRGTALRAWLGDIRQAGQRNILVDQDRHTLYYGIHVNSAFARFIDDYRLRTVSAVKNADASLFFPAGLVEFKSAWKDIDPNDGISAADYANYTANYITTTAWVPHLMTDPTTTLIVEDKDHPRRIKVALVALHVVYTLPGHPEFIWTSFQHVDPTAVDPNTGAEARSDTAPTFGALPTLADPNNNKKKDVVSQSDFLLYHGGTPASGANQPLSEAQLQFNEATQSFGQATSIYRMYPGSKSNDINPDDAVISLNDNVAALFAQRAPSDKRSHYRLVGGTWLDKPEFFALDRSLQNDDSSPLYTLTNLKSEETFTQTSQDEERKAVLQAGLLPRTDLANNGSDSPFSILAGEDRMSSTAMESFTQGYSSFNNCFTCHNTQAITQRGVPVDRDKGQPTLLDPKLLNVSHVFSEVILQECGPGGVCP